MSYVLRHTAEELDHKLDLIDINRNLLPYPYNTTFPTGIEDTGDGSILTTAYSSSEKTVFLTADVLLPAGTYTASVETTDGIDTDKVVENPGFALVIVDNKDTTNEITINAAGQFVLTDTTVIKVSLAIPDSFNPGIVIKPQIEVGLAKTPWTPYMKSIGSYVDERFNSTNTKIKALAESIADISDPDVDLSNVLTIAYGEGSVADGENSRAAGLRAIAISRNTQAEGNSTFAGCRGYYWQAINFDNKKIYLCKEQTTPTIDTSIPQVIREVSNIEEVTAGGYGGTISVDANIQHPYLINAAGICDYEYWDDDRNEIITESLTFENVEFALMFESEENDAKAYRIDVSTSDLNVPGALLRVHVDFATLVYDVSGCIDTSFTPDYAVGDELAIVNNNKYFPSATIKTIQNNVITYKGDIGFNSIMKVDSEQFDLDDYCAYVVAKPAPEQSVAPENRICKSIKRDAHAEGCLSKATGNASHAEGTQTIAYGDHSHAEGNRTKAAWAAHSEGNDTTASGFRSHAEGTTTVSSGTSSHAEGTKTRATTYDAHAEGNNTLAGTGTKPSVNPNTVSGNYSHAEGNGTWAEGNSSHAEGKGTHAVGLAAHTEGQTTTASGIGAHAEGSGTQAVKDRSHAEGLSTIANGDQSHAEGYGSEARGSGSHAEGVDFTLATGRGAHAEGYGATTKKDANGSTIPDESTYNILVANITNEAFVNSSPVATKLRPAAAGTGSHTEGMYSYATGNGAHAEGYTSYSNGQGAHAEGSKTVANGTGAHAEGVGGSVIRNNITYYSGAAGTGAHSEGEICKAIGTGAHAEGRQTQAIGYDAHAEGYLTKATTNHAHAEGNGTTASGNSSHAEGRNTKATNTTAHAEGDATNATNEASHAEGRKTTASGKYSHAEGNETGATGEGSHAEGYKTVAGNGNAPIPSATTTVGYYAHAEGNGTLAKGNSSHAEGIGTQATGEGAHAEGSWFSEYVYTGSNGMDTSTLVDFYSTASGKGAHAEGLGSIASGEGAHAEGHYTQATGAYAHAEGSGWPEGYRLVASGNSAHAEGSGTTASGAYSHAEGCITEASGESAHAEGYNAKASGNYSHAGGTDTEATVTAAFAHGTQAKSNHENSAVFGNHTESGAKNQLVIGEYNAVSDIENALVIGNGSRNVPSSTVISGDGTITGAYVKTSQYYSNYTFTRESFGQGTLLPSGLYQFTMQSGGGTSPGDLAFIDITDFFSDPEIRFVSQVTEEYIPDGLDHYPPTFLTITYTKEQLPETFENYTIIGPFAGHCKGYTKVEIDAMLDNINNKSNAIGANATNAVALGGTNNSTVSTNSVLLGGNNNSITSTECENAVVGGTGNTLSDGKNNVIFGSSNTISETGTYVDGSPQYCNDSFIVGANNAIHADRCFATGFHNLIDTSADQAVVEGLWCTTNASAAHAGGVSSKAVHRGAFAYGYGVETGRAAQTVVGEFNKVSADALFIVGNGNGSTKTEGAVEATSRTNAFEVHKDGTVNINGKLVINGIAITPIGMTTF